MKPHSQKFLQQRKFYIVLPLLVLPFLTIIFWALGGGRDTPHTIGHTTSGLNVELPGARFDKNDEHWNKLALYEQARRDSVRYEQARRSDPYYNVVLLKGHTADSLPATPNRLNASLGSGHRDYSLQQQEQRINDRLAQLTGRLATSDAANERQYAETTTAIAVETGPMPEDIARLEKMMTVMASTDASDPELQQIDGVLDKILDIQHPDRVTAKAKAIHYTSRGQVHSVGAATIQENITLMGRLGEDAIITDSIFSINSMSTPHAGSNAFFDLEDDDSPSGVNNSNTFQAIVHDTQKVVSGSTIKMRLLTDVYIGEQVIPKNQFIYGVCTINGERMSVNINTIELDGMLLPVSLQVYDLDGQEGIYIPDAITRDVARQTSAQSIQDLQLYSLDNSLEGQAASAGIEAAKGVFTKKAKLVEVTVKAGYQLLLRDNSTL